MSRATLQSVLALPMCVLQVVVLAESLWGDDAAEMSASPALLVGVAVISLFGMYALRASIQSDPLDETVGRGRLILIGLIVMLAADVCGAIRFAILMWRIGLVIMMCGPVAMTLLLGGRLSVTVWNLADRVRRLREPHLASEL